MKSFLVQACVASAALVASSYAIPGDRLATYLRQQDGYRHGSYPAWVKQQVAGMLGGRPYHQVFGRPSNYHPGRKVGHGGRSRHGKGGHGSGDGDWMRLALLASLLGGKRPNLGDVDPQTGGPNPQYTETMVDPSIFDTVEFLPETGGPNPQYIETMLDSLRLDTVEFLPQTGGPYEQLVETMDDPFFATVQSNNGRLDYTLGRAPQTGGPYEQWTEEMVDPFNAWGNVDLDYTWDMPQTGGSYDSLQVSMDDPLSLDTVEFLPETGGPYQQLTETMTTNPFDISVTADGRLNFIIEP